MGPLVRFLDLQRDRFFLWVPVCLGVGVAVYFALPHEPGIVALVLSAGLAVAGLLGWRHLPDPVRYLSLIPVLVVAGVFLGLLRAHMIDARPLEHPFYGAVEGEVAGFSRSASGLPRVLLKDVVLHGRGRYPSVRVALSGDAAQRLPEAGARILLTAYISAPEGPVEPDGFDFRRMAYFQRLSAIGYTRVPWLRADLAPPAPSFWLSLREDISARIRAAAPEGVSGLMVALLTGDRAALQPEVVEALRRSNLAHLLAISGLHMGLVAGLALVGLRSLLMLWPRVALRLPVRQISALGAMGAATFYLLLSGASIPTQRAYIMAIAVLLAVVLQRPALTLRSVAIAALGILLMRPEALLEAGFQMSFAASTSLIAVFSWLRPYMAGRKGAINWIGTLLLSSAIAGGATAPYSAFHFNTLSHYGLLANLLALPVVSFVVMPMGMIAVLLMPVGLETVPLHVMSLGLEWIIFAADKIAHLPNAVSLVPSGPEASLWLFSLGGIAAAALRGPTRIGGGVLVTLGIGLWAMTPRPALLVSPERDLVGVMTDEGRALSRSRGGGYAAQTWLENDGDASDRAQAVARFIGPSGKGWAAIVLPDGGQIVHIYSDKATAPPHCGPQDIWILRNATPVPDGCLILGPEGGNIPMAFSASDLSSRRLTKTDAPQRLWTQDQ